MEYKIIVNPAAGRGKAGKQVQVLKDLLTVAGLEYHLEMTRCEGHATDLARQAVRQGWPAVVAVGGDGTINETATGLAGSDTALGVIPLGTGNDFARSLRLPKTLPEAVKSLANPSSTLIDMGEDQGNYFLCIAGIGFPADVMYNVNARKGLFSGSAAILWGILKTLKELREIHLTLEIDDHSLSVKAQGVFILNTMYAGGGLRFAPQADYCDGLLDVLVMQDMSRTEVMGLLPRVYTGTHLSFSKVGYYRVRKVSLFPEGPVRKMVDGNIIGNTPLRAKIFHKQLKVLTPI